MNVTRDLTSTVLKRAPGTPDERRQGTSCPHCQKRRPQRKRADSAALPDKRQQRLTHRGRRGRLLPFQFRCEAERSRGYYRCLPKSRVYPFPAFLIAIVTCSACELKSSQGGADSAADVQTAGASLTRVTSMSAAAGAP